MLLAGKRGSQDARIEEGEREALLTRWVAPPSALRNTRCSQWSSRNRVRADPMARGRSPSRLRPLWRPPPAPPPHPLYRPSRGSTGRSSLCRRTATSRTHRGASRWSPAWRSPPPPPPWPTAGRLGLRGWRRSGRLDQCPTLSRWRCWGRSGGTSPSLRAAMRAGRPTARGGQEEGAASGAAGNQKR